MDGFPYLPFYILTYLQFSVIKWAKQLRVYIEGFSVSNGALVCTSVGSSLLLEEPMDPVPEIFKDEFQFNFGSSFFPKLRFDSNSGFSFFGLF